MFARKYQFMHSFLRRKYHDFIKYRPYVRDIDLKKRILEIGPLTSPMLEKTGNVFYADVRSTEEIRDFYKDHQIDHKKICEIDYVVKNTYAETFSGEEKFDYVIAGHVIEHIPEFIAFFHDISTIMKEGARLCLTIPDKRYCFDHFRIPTSFAEIYNVYVNGIRNNPPRVLENCMYALGVNKAEYFWGNNDSEKFLLRTNDFDEAQKKYEQALNGECVNAHYSVFTPESFLLLLFGMVKASIMPFKCAEFYATQPGTLEFNAVLRFEPSLLLRDVSQRQSELENLVKFICLNKKEELNFMRLRSRLKIHIVRILKKLCL
jgi:2-polyprenyl-3-methyl-5-hydroxy-6-metoxy-1,4-benzoquinol methylase